MFDRLELEYEIQSKITSAALKIANDSHAAKSVRKQRKVSYQVCPLTIFFHFVLAQNFLAYS